MDECGFCKGEPGYGSQACVGCNAVDITNTQLDIDAGVKGQEKRIRFVFKLVNKFFDPEPIPPWFTKKSQKPFLAEVHQLQDTAWRRTWSIPSVVSLCDNPAPFCVTSNENQLAMEEYLDLTDQLHRLARQTFKKARKSVSDHPDKIDQPEKFLRFIKLQAKAEQKRWKKNREGALSIPPVAVSCVGLNAEKIKLTGPRSNKNP